MWYEKEKAYEIQMWLEIGRVLDRSISGLNVISAALTVISASR